MCETSGVGTKWPQRHTLILGKASTSGQEMCLPKGRKEDASETGQVSLLEEVAAKHEYEELKEGVGLRADLALLRKTKEGWTEKHRNVARMLILEGGRVLGRMKVNVTPVTRRKAQKSTRSAQKGTNSVGRSQRLPGSGSKKQEPQRRNGSGKELL